MAITPHLGLTLIESAQAQKEITANTAFTRLDAILNTGAIDKDLATPPGSPAEGDVYIVAASPTGAWAGQAKSIAYFDQVWKFIVPNEGLTLWVRDEDKLYTYDGTNWVLSVTIPAAITTLNGLTDASQSFSVGSTGSDFAISSAAGVHTFNLPSAGPTVRGLISTTPQTFEGTKSFVVTDSATNSVTTAAVVGHNSSATPTAAYGTGFSFQGKSSTTNDMFMSQIRSTWIDATHATRSATLIFSAVRNTVDTELFRFGLNGMGVGTTAPQARIHGATDDAVTNANTDIVIAEHSSTGTPAAGFAASVAFRLESSTTAGQDAGKVTALWTDATHATRTSALAFSTVASGTLQEGMRLTSTSAVFGATSINAAAAVQIDSTTRGFLPPRMSTTQRNAISSPPAGLVIYNNTTNKLNVYTGAAWEAVTSA